MPNIVQFHSVTLNFNPFPNGTMSNKNLACQTEMDRIGGVAGMFTDHPRKVTNPRVQPILR